MKLKKILETAKNITDRLFIVFYCDGQYDIKKVEMNTKNICLQTMNGPVFQIIGVFDDSEFMNFIHTKTTNSDLISSINVTYMELNKHIVSAKVYYEYKSWFEILNYDFTDKNICDVVKNFKSVVFKRNLDYNKSLLDICEHKICDACYLNDIHYCFCKPETSTYNYFNCKCLENLDLDFLNQKTNLSLANYRLFCIPEDQVKIILDEKHPEHEKLCHAINLSIGIYYS